MDYKNEKGVGSQLLGASQPELTHVRLVCWEAGELGNRIPTKYLNNSTFTVLLKVPYVMPYGFHLKSKERAWSLCLLVRE